MPDCEMPPTVIRPDWPAPDNVKALLTTRIGGCSPAPYDSLNLGFHVADNSQNARQNWQALSDRVTLPEQPRLLNQVHGHAVVELPSQQADPINADGAFSRQIDTPCTVLSADCLPVLLCDQSGRQVAALHAGWRGLADNILGRGVSAFAQPEQLMAYLGPAICPVCFEVGAEVKAVFLEAAQSWGSGADAVSIEGCFKPVENNHYLADLYQLARYCLSAAGVTDIYGGQYCTVEQHQQFFSYRRDGETGRMASIIWLSADS